MVQTVNASACEVSANGKLVLLQKTHPGCRATCTSPNSDAVNAADEPLAIDIEFQEYKKKTDVKWSHRIGRIALVNTRGKTVYDTYVRYAYDPELEVKVPPKWLGFQVEWKDLALANGAKRAKEVEGNLRKLFKGRLIVGHGMRLDKTAVGEVWSDDHIKDGVAGALIYDTQHHYGQRALSYLVGKHLEGEDFDFHNPVEDAKATMLLRLLHVPYQGRNSFRDVAPKKELYDDEFPALK